MIRQKQNLLSANWIAPADSIRNVFRLIGCCFVWLGKLGERTRQLWQDNSRHVGTHENNSGETVDRLGTIIHSIFCAQSGASIRLTVWKWSCESQYPGALPPMLENFCCALFPGPTDPPGSPRISFLLLVFMQYLCTHLKNSSHLFKRWTALSTG